MHVCMFVKWTVRSSDLNALVSSTEIGTDSLPSEASDGKPFYFDGLHNGIHSVFGHNLPTYIHTF